MPVRDGARVYFDSLECRWLISSLTIARDALQAKSKDPTTPDSEAHEYEQSSIRFDMLCDELIELADEADREATQNFIEDQAKKRQDGGR